MIRQLKNPLTGSVFSHDDNTQELDVRSTAPELFNEFGKKMIYKFYKSFIIVRATQQFRGCKPERLTILYVYIHTSKNEPGMVYLNQKYKTFQEAELCADRILETGILEL